MSISLPNGNTEQISLSQLLRPRLNEDLVNRDEFLAWYNGCLVRIEKIASDI